MIVTRNRRKPFPWKKLLLPIVAIALLVFAVTWGPSRNVIASGPMAPLWRVSGNLFGNVAAPFSFARQNQILTDRNRQIVQLQAQIADTQSKDQTKDKRIAALQAQVGQLQAQVANTHTAASPTPARPNPNASAAPGAAAANGAVPAAGDLSTGATADMHRTAQYWASMEPENAAKLVQKLPVAYVARVMSLMSADAVGSILDALPAAYAAQLTQEHPELRR